MNKLLNNLLGMYKQAKLNKKAEEVVYDSDLIAQVLSMTKNQKEDEFSIVTLSPEKDKVLGVKYIKKDEVYDYKPNQNEYALVMTRDTGFADTDYQLQPMSMVVRSWNEGRKFYATKKNRLNKKAEEDLIEVGWGLGTNTEEEIKDNAEWGDSDNPRETDKTFWDKINKDIENVENAFLKDGYKQFFTKVRDEGHHMDGVLGGTAWMTKEQLKDFIERAENYGGEEYVLSESSGSLDLKSPIDYDESIMFSVYVYVDEEILDNLNIEAKRVSKNKKLSSEKTRKSLHKKAISGFSADVMEINERKLDEIRNTAKDMGDEIWARINENIVKIIAYGYEDGKLKIVYREPYYGKEEIEEMYENADEVSLADFQTLELQREAKISHNLSKKAGWKVLTPKDLTEEVKDEFLKDSIKEYAGHVKREDFYFVKGIKEKEDDQFSYEWEEGMFGEWRTNVKGEKWYSLTDLGDDWDYIYLIKEDKLYKMPKRESLTDFGVVSSKAKAVKKDARTITEKDISETLTLEKEPYDRALNELSQYYSEEAKGVPNGSKEMYELNKKYTDLRERLKKKYKIKATKKKAKIELIENVWYKIFGYPLSLKYLGKDKGGRTRWEKADGTEVVFDVDVEIEPYEYSYSPFSNDKQATKKQAGIDPNVSAEEIVKLNFDMPIEKADKVKEQFNEKGIKYESRKGKYTVEFSVDIEAGKVDLVYEIIRNIKKLSSTKKQAEKVLTLKEAIGKDESEFKNMEDIVDYMNHLPLNANKSSWTVEGFGGNSIDVENLSNGEKATIKLKKNFNSRYATRQNKLFKSATIKHENGVYNVYSESGKCLGKGYKTKEEAEKRLKQVEYFKHKSSLKQVVISKMAKIKK